MEQVNCTRRKAQCPHMWPGLTIAGCRQCGSDGLSQDESVQLLCILHPVATANALGGNTSSFPRFVEGASSAHRLAFRSLVEVEQRKLALADNRKTFRPISILRLAVCRLHVMLMLDHAFFRPWRSLKRKSVVFEEPIEH